MNKYDFIVELQRHLTGNVSPQKMQELIIYYQEYIEMQIQKGKSEQEILDSLGNPRLLAKSIVMAEGESIDRQDDHQKYGYTNKMNEDAMPKAKFIINGKEVPRWKIWAIIIAIIIVLLIVLFLVGQLLGLAFMVLFKYIIPILIPVIVFYLVYTLFFGNKR